MNNNKPAAIVFIRRLTLLALMTSLTACISTTPEPQVQALNEQSATEVNPYLALANEKRRFRPEALPRNQKKQLKHAMAQAKQQQWTQAAASITHLLNDPSVNTQVLIFAGDLARSQAVESAEPMPLLDKAADYYLQVIGRESRNYNAHNRLAGVYRQKGQFEHALKHYQLAINSWPGFALAYRNRGILNDLYLGEKASALQDYQIYLGLNELAEGQQNRQVKGWIADLSRQLDSQLAQTGGKHEQ